MSTHAAAAPSPELVFDTLFAYQRTAALRAAIEIDLFRAIGEGPGDAASLATQRGASPRGVRILCDFLTIQGLLQKSDGRYTHALTSALFLDPQSPACIASTARFLANPMIQQPFDSLAEIVRTGRTVLPGDGSVEPNNPAWVEFAHSMAPMMAPMAGPLGAIALEGLRGPNRGTRHGRAARSTSISGPHDVVLLTNFLHHFDPPTCVTLLKKARASLRDGGRVAALEFVPNDDRVSPPLSAAFSLTMLASTPAGDAYTLRELETMYRSAGFTDVTGHPLRTGPHTVVVGRAA